MDVNEYKAANQPTKKLDSLINFKSGLFELRHSGYSYSALSKWLRINDIEVSEHTVRRFFAKNTEEYQLYCKDV